MLRDLERYHGDGYHNTLLKRLMASPNQSLRSADRISQAVTAAWKALPPSARAAPPSRSSQS